MITSKHLFWAMALPLAACTFDPSGVARSAGESSSSSEAGSFGTLSSSSGGEPSSSGVGSLGSLGSEGTTTGEATTGGEAGSTGGGTMSGSSESSTSTTADGSSGSTGGPIPLEPGVLYRYYEDRFELLPDFAALEPVAEGVAPNFTLDVALADERYALQFEGLLQVPRNGNYTFFLTSDDGSRLFIDGALVVDHDGLHEESTARGSLALQAGLVPIRVEYFELEQDEVLEVRWQGPALLLQPIPDRRLFLPGE